MTWEISYTPTFRRNFRKLPRHIQMGFLSSFELFEEDVFHPSLSTHELRWTMSWLYASSIDGEYRFITRLDQNKKTILLFNIWDHSIYRP